MRRIDLVIFDCDGVLVDSERLIVRLEAQICQERGWPLTEEDVIREFVGLSDSAMRARLSEIVGEELAEDWDAEYTDRYRNALAEGVEAVSGVEAAIDAIERAGLATFVASSGSHQKMALTLGKTGMLARFDGRIFSSTDPEVQRGKPAPDLFPTLPRAWGRAQEMRRRRGQPLRSRRSNRRRHESVRLYRRCDAGPPARGRRCDDLRIDGRPSRARHERVNTRSLAGVRPPPEALRASQAMPPTPVEQPSLCALRLWTADSS